MSGLDLPKPLPLQPFTGYSDYRDVPWLRKSGTNTMFVLLHLVTLGILPFLLITCIMLVTGDIYYNKVGPDGKLKKWSFANKIVAVILMIPPMLFLAVILFGVAAQIAGF